MNQFEWDCERHCAAIYRSSGYLHQVYELENYEWEDFYNLQKEIELLCANTESFLFKGMGVNVLLWGARGCGKSSLIKALLPKYAKAGLRILQIFKQDLKMLPEILDFLRTKDYKFIVFCDDLSFNENDQEYKNLKTILEGSIERFPQNIRFYVTSNRRHLMPEFHSENEIFGFEGNEDKIALFERFPLCIGFYTHGNQEYLEVLQGYFKKLPLELQNPDNWENIRQKALIFASKRGSKNPRIATQFFKLYESGLIDLI